jgi:hypothetical protein
MTIIENIEAAIAKIDSILLLDYITGPVREELTQIKAYLRKRKSGS